jgi:hypothetical protein
MQVIVHMKLVKENLFLIIVNQAIYISDHELHS